MRIYSAVAAMLGLIGCTANADEGDAQRAFTRALAPVLAADLPETLARLQALPAASLNTAQRRTRDCVLARFGAVPAHVPDEGALPAPVAAVLRAYRAYWTAALMKTMSPEAAESVLSAALGAVAGIGPGDLETRADAAGRLIESEGLHVLGGVTPPLKELMLWRRQAAAAERIMLPGGSFDVVVTQLDDFISLGWAAWATCDHSHTGGWTTPEGIMVVAAAWDPGSEAYRVSLLAHEAQHFSDYRTYPELGSADLEYRAKLTELILANDTRQALLVKFAAQAGREREQPHPFANHWVIERMRARLGSSRWEGFDRATISQAASAELAAHTQALDARGRDTVKTVLPD